MWVESKRGAVFLEGFMLQVYSFIRVLSFGGMKNYLLLRVYMRVKKPSKWSTYHFCSSVVGSLAFQHAFRKAVHRLGRIGSERLSHLPKVTGKQQHKDASSLFSALSPVAHVFEELQANNPLMSRLHLFSLLSDG